MDSAVIRMNRQFRIKEKRTITVPEIKHKFEIMNGSSHGWGQLTAINGSFG